MFRSSSLPLIFLFTIHTPMSGISRLLGTIAIGFFLFSINVSATDLLERVVQPAKDYEQIIDLGNSREAVGNEIFRE